MKISKIALPAIAILAIGTACTNRQDIANNNPSENDKKMHGGG